MYFVQKVLQDNKSIFLFPLIILKEVEPKFDLLNATHENIEESSIPRFPVASNSIIEGKYQL